MTGREEIFYPSGSIGAMFPEATQIVEGLLAERDRAKAAIKREEMFCNAWEAPTRRRMHAHEWVDLTRAALAEGGAENG